MKCSIRFAVIACVVTLLVTVVAASTPPAVGVTGRNAAQERVEAAKAAFEAAKARYGAGLEVIDNVYQWSVRWAKAQRPWGTSASAALQDHLNRMKELEQAAKAKFESGQAAVSDKLGAIYFRAEAEVWASGGATD